MTITPTWRVGALEETLTVTGAAPTVDVQTTTKSQVADNAKHSTRFRLAALIQRWAAHYGRRAEQPDVGGCAR